MSIVDAKLSRQPPPKIDMLHDLYEIVRIYQPQLDTTDWICDAVRKVIDLTSLDRASPFSDNSSAGSEGPHPSLYLRMAMASLPEHEHGGFLGENAPADVGLLRIVGPGLMSHIKLILDKDPNARSTPSARTAASERHASIETGQAIRQRIAAWSVLDQAISSELGIVSPPNLSTAHEAVVGTPATSVVHPVDEGNSTAAWREIADRAFSEIGDAQEACFLDAFAFRDQAPCAGFSVAPLDWTASEPEQSLSAVDREPTGISPEAARDRADVDTTRMESPERMWTEYLEQLKPETAP